MPDGFLLAGKFQTLTSYFSLTYLAVFLPACIIIYSLMPSKAKKYFLLASSYAFFWFISGKLTVYLLFSTISIFLFGLWLGKLYKNRDLKLKLLPKEQRKPFKNSCVKKARGILAFAVIIHIGMLLVLKYSPFFLSNINVLLKLSGSDFAFQIPTYAVPIGISFFTMQAVSYVIDVYREVIKPDRNIFRLGLFMSFFPQIVEGPICRYSQTAEQIWNVKKIEYQNLKFGVQRIIFGLLKKLVIADRLNMLISEVFANYNCYEGGVIAIGAVCYTIQLYMDFSGTMDAVIGTAQIFGVKMPENFERPFFSKTVSEFWKRWHITLGAWFKDYIFYPVTMSKPMKKLTNSARKKIGNHFGPLIAGGIALFCVWISNGLWHGAGWNYIFFGMYYFVLILIGNIIAPAAAAVNKKFGINSQSGGYKAFQIIRTCIIVVIGEMFFRAEGLRAGFSMFKKLVTNFSFSSINDELLKKLGIDTFDFIIVAITLVIIFVVSLLNERKIAVREVIDRQNVVVKYIIFLALITYIIIFGAYGAGYVPVAPIYASF